MSAPIATPLPPVHAAAETFPLMEPAELRALADDMKENGQHEPIMLLDGRILDGRNRWLACQLVGLKPRTQEWRAGDASPWRYTWSENARRRHLEKGLLAALGIDHLEGDEKWKAERDAARARANKGRSDKAKAQPKVQTAKGSRLAPGAGSNDPRPGKSGHPERRAAAAFIGVSPATYERARQLKQKDPKAHAAVVAGKTKAHQALAAAKRQERVEKLVEIAKGNAALDLADRYPVLLADPPWRYEHVETESRAIENQYPTMALDEICALSVSAATTDDCVLFLWATSPKLAEAIRVIEAWGFTYRSCAVWVKDKIGMGYYFRQQHELLLVAVKGNPPTPAPADRPPSVITAERTKHSAKPLEAYEAIERMYPSLPKAELFSRAPREGWFAWGNQAQ